MLKIAFDLCYAHPLPEGHRFPMEKYSLLPEQLRYEGTLSADNFFIPGQAADSDILKVHEEAYLRKLRSGTLSRREERATGFPLSPELLHRELTITGGTIEAVIFAMQHGVSGNIAGGTHHAFRDRGEGFCLLNDAAVAARYAIDHLGINNILIVDLDVHQGNGTAKIFEDEPRVFTFSMHGAKNYPLHKEKSDLDIPLPDGMDDAAYLAQLRATLPKLIDQTEPQLMFFQSGVDVLESDKLGRLALTIEGCKQRDAFVFNAAKANGIPVVFNMGGGYSSRIATIVEAHANTYRVAQEIFF